MHFLLKRSILFCLTILFCTVPLMADNEEQALEDKTFTIVLDAGHGGHDAGAVGSFSKEKDINLKVTLEVGRLLKAYNPEIRVVYTRSTDVFIPLDRRAEIANKNKADLFVSIHTNSLPKGNIAYGSETYTLGMARAAANLEVAKRENAVITYEKNYKQTYEGFDPNKAESYIIFELLQDRYMKQSVELARCIQQQYVSAGRKNKGVHQAGFLVLRKTSMPAVLTELGFISTPEEERYLNSAAGVQALAKSIYNGIAKYRGTQGRMVPQAISPIILPNEIDKPEPSRVSDGSNDLKATANLEPAVVPVDPNPQPVRVEQKREEKTETPETPSRNRKPSVASVQSGITPVAKSPANASGIVGVVKRDSAPAQRRNVTVVKRDSTPAKQNTSAATPRQNTSTTAVKREGGNHVDKPVFKVQIFVVDRQLKANDARLKGLQNVSFYKEGNLYKYTVGESTSYSEIRRLQKTLTQKCPGNFIVAFKNGQRMNLSEAIRISK